MQLNLRLRCHSKIVLAQLDIMTWNKIGILISLNLKLTRHRLKLRIKISMKVNNITKFLLKKRYHSEIILAQSETASNKLGFVIKLTFVWQNCKSYLKFMFINQLWDDNFSWRLRRYFTTTLYTHLILVYPENNTKFRIK